MSLHVLRTDMTVTAEGRTELKEVPHAAALITDAAGWASAVGISRTGRTPKGNQHLGKQASHGHSHRQSHLCSEWKGGPGTWGILALRFLICK